MCIDQTSLAVLHFPGFIGFVVHSNNYASGICCMLVIQTWCTDLCSCNLCRWWAEKKMTSVFRQLSGQIVTCYDRNTSCLHIWSASFILLDKKVRVFHRKGDERTSQQNSAAKLIGIATMVLFWHHLADSVANSDSKMTTFSWWALLLKGSYLTRAWLFFTGCVYIHDREASVNWDVQSNAYHTIPFWN